MSRSSISELFAIFWHGSTHEIPKFALPKFRTSDQKIKIFSDTEYITLKVIFINVFLQNTNLVGLKLTENSAILITRNTTKWSPSSYFATGSDVMRCMMGNFFFFFLKYFYINDTLSYVVWWEKKNGVLHLFLSCIVTEIQAVEVSNLQKIQDGCRHPSTTFPLNFLSTGVTKNSNISPSDIANSYNYYAWAPAFNST